jgi:Taurine catabolism dioxygenase TauD, TfdA family
MLRTLPDTATLDVPPARASELLKRACALPNYDNKEFYSTQLQEHVCEFVREGCLDDFDWLIGEVKTRIARWPYCVLVRGLTFDEGNRLFVALNRAFGELMARPYEKPRAQLVHYIQPATDLPSARGGHESERLHTDTADWKDPVEMISMVCVRADPAGGGRSRVLDVDSIREEIKNRLGQQTLQLLETTPVPWQLASYCGGGVNWRPVLGKSQVCWRRYTINLALESNGLELPQEMLTTLDAFEDLLTSTTRTIEFLMRESELLLSDNIRTIHARTPIAGGTASNRLMIRSWVRTSKKNNGNAVCSTF